MTDREQFHLLLDAHDAALRELRQAMRERDQTHLAHLDAATSVQALVAALSAAHDHNQAVQAAVDKAIDAALAANAVALRLLRDGE